VLIVWKSGILSLLEASGLVQACKGLLYLFTSLNEAVLCTIYAEAAKIKESYDSTNSMMMGCMENNWMNSN